MNIEIKSWYKNIILFSIEAASLKVALELAIKSGADLSRAELSGADLSGTNLSKCDLSGANLSKSDLSGADLSGTNLSKCDLSRADLSGTNLSKCDLSRADLFKCDLSRAELSGTNLFRADLFRADLSGADLSGAKNIDPNRCCPLRILLDQPGPIWAYKLIKENGEGPFNGGINYLDTTKNIFAANKIDPDINVECSEGINLATLDWCMREWKAGFRILIMEFFANQPKGNLVVPTATDGKFRVKECRRIGEKDLKELGLVN